MPGGPPSRVALSRMSLGLVEGFFGHNFVLTVTSSAQPLHLDIDLHKCIGQNILFFTSVWSAAWLIFEQLSNGTRSTEAGMSEAAVAEAMMLLPGALHRCNINEEQQSMLMESLKALSQVKVRLHTLQKSVETSQVSVDLAKSIRDWTKCKWHAFGSDLGQLLREMVLVILPQKYHVDGAGVLRRQLLRASELSSHRLSQGAVAMGAGAAVLVAAAVYAGRRLFHKEEAALPHPAGHRAELKTTLSELSEDGLEEAIE